MPGKDGRRPATGALADHDPGFSLGFNLTFSLWRIGYRTKQSQEE
jgi:hypothetical protein